MSESVRILGINGSLRTGSLNGLALEALGALVPEGATFEVFSGLGDVPLYNQDLDTPEPPAAVAHLREAIRSADALLIASPEYNHSISGVLKNAIDWASRPMIGSCLTGKCAAIVVSGPGRGGTRSWVATAAVLRDLAVHVVTFPELVVNEAHSKVVRGDDGVVRFVEPPTQRIGEALVGELVAAAQADAGQVHRRSLESMVRALRG